MSDIELVHGDLTERIIGEFYAVFRELGSGFLEVLYQRAMQIALEEVHISSRREVPAIVQFRGRRIGRFRLDLVVDDRVVVECKTADRITPAHRVQLLNYLKASNLQVGLILNFGKTPTFSRVVNESSRQR